MQHLLPNEEDHRWDQSLTSFKLAQDQLDRLSRVKHALNGNKSPRMRKLHFRFRHPTKGITVQSVVSNMYMVSNWERSAKKIPTLSFVKCQKRPKRSKSLRRRMMALPVSTSIEMKLHIKWPNVLALGETDWPFSQPVVNANSWATRRKCSRVEHRCQLSTDTGTRADGQA
jgi:hypothetical protein